MAIYCNPCVAPTLTVRGLCRGHQPSEELLCCLSLQPNPLSFHRYSSCRKNLLNLHTPTYYRLSFRLHWTRPSMNVLRRKASPLYIENALLVESASHDLDGQRLGVAISTSLRPAHQDEDEVGRGGTPVVSARCPRRSQHQKAGPGRPGECTLSKMPSWSNLRAMTSNASALLSIRMKERPSWAAATPVVPLPLAKKSSTTRRKRLLRRVAGLLLAVRADSPAPRRRGSRRRG